MSIIFVLVSGIVISILSGEAVIEVMNETDKYKGI